MIRTRRLAIARRSSIVGFPRRPLDVSAPSGLSRRLLAIRLLDLVETEPGAEFLLLLGDGRESQGPFLQLDRPHEVPRLGAGCGERRTEERLLRWGGPV